MSVIKSNFNFETEFKTSWITDKLDEKGIDYLENFGFYLCDKKDVNAFSPGFNAATSTQLRNVFSEVKRIHARVVSQSESDAADWRDDFVMLRPKIAYNAARVLSQKRDNRIKQFRELMELAHQAVGEDKDNFLRFSQFTEAIIAYHKVYGGQ
jgi:CRISPR type III-A-associated protein Csm2